MSIAKSLPDVHKFFMQECPLCGRSNRVVVKGVYVYNDKLETHPDMGYSFCNCKSIFYTRPENVLDRVDILPDVYGIITYPDPFFAWPDPYQFQYWDVRKYEVLWDMDELCGVLEERGNKIIKAWRDFEVGSKTPQHFHIQIKRLHNE